MDKQTDLILRLQDEADLCRNEGADDLPPNAAGEGLSAGCAVRQSSREAATSTGLLEGGKDKA